MTTVAVVLIIQEGKGKIRWLLEKSKQEMKVIAVEKVEREVRKGQIQEIF